MASTKSAPDVLLWGCCDLGKPRTRIALAAMEGAGISLRRIHRDLWKGVEDKSQLGTLHRLLFGLRWLLAYPALLLRFAFSRKPDVILLAYPGLLDALIIGPFARLLGIPIVWDVFICAYDTVVRDRGMLAPGSLAARLLHRAERLAARQARLLTFDTSAHAQLFARLYDLPPEKLRSVFVGAEADAFAPSIPADQSTKGDGPTHVLFYGQFIPLHGIETIIRAAALPDAQGMCWTIIGTGQDAPRIRAMLAKTPLPALHWIDWCEYGELHRHIAAADVTLGIFGESEKAASVIPNKVFQLLLSGRPVVTRDSPAMRELVTGNEPGIALVPPADPRALLAGIRELAGGPAQPGHGAINARFASDTLGRQWRAIITEIVA